MDYSQAVDFLYTQTPQFQQIGAAAYKPGLDTVRKLAAAFGNPQDKLKCIHVGGTNGKGSTSHSIASVLQASGKKTGLFTSPHLLDFRERIRIDGKMIPQENVVAFVEECIRRGLVEELKPSFFELTTVMAFNWFAECGTDFAVIEVGLGGRLDSTNIITPLLSVITNISFDHTAQLGNTLAEIAGEKAGIIKPGVPVVIGEAEGEVKNVFAGVAAKRGAPLVDAMERFPDFISSCAVSGNRLVAGCTPFGEVTFDLTGDCQTNNLRTILAALESISEFTPLSDSDVKRGLDTVTSSTGLRGRWMTLSDHPLTICDTGHNIGGWEYLSKRLSNHQGMLIMVIGFVNDKDISHILPLMPPDGYYLFTRASVPRALPAEILAEKAAGVGLKGHIVTGVGEAIDEARRIASGAVDCNPMIFIGGSTFVVADALGYISQ
ncbi:bifunctional folylpolyglutamate synthase/dihydrofolate synthase [Muribaculaceae bacterium Isolate-013 (NCI)]|nr:bifunctional folylpolyglutamate synthase/dihydrofolate synthase [Muribaculaceae bacterium Isolate-013 (NCI)]